MNQKKRTAAEPKRRTKKGDKNALHNIVSLRISDQEKHVLERITRRSKQNLSEVIREALSFYLAQRQTLCY